MKNELYPVFLKVNQLNLLVVGGGTVALEKLTFLLKSSPNANVALLSKTFDPELFELAKNQGITMVYSSYSPLALKNKNIVIAATNDHRVNRQIYKDAKTRNILVNVADTPDLCDFYMGGIVTKGQVKIAISTNGQSPTLAKRLRQFFEEILPDDLNELAENLNRYRTRIEGDFSNKVRHLNKLTSSLLTKETKM